MQRHDYDTMSRDRTGYGSRDRDWSDRDNDRSAFFGADRSDRYGRDRDYSSDHRSDYRSDYRRGERGSEDRFGRSDGRSGHHDLIASDRVEGTAVYGRDRDKLGEIHNFMVEKRGGKVRYAVMKCSDGFLGMDERYYPIDWSELDYDPRLDGYRVNMSERDLDNRPSFDSRGRRMDRRGDYERSDRRSNW